MRRETRSKAPIRSSARAYAALFKRDEIIPSHERTSWIFVIYYGLLISYDAALSIVSLVIAYKKFIVHRDAYKN